MQTEHNQTNDHAVTEPVQKTIFSDMLDTTAYQKPIKNARIWLYVIAALQVGIGIYEYATTYDKDVALMAGLIDVGIGLLFLFFAFLSFKKPFGSFVAALVTYIVVQIGTMFIDPTNLVKGILIKIIIVVSLVRAITNARDIQRIQETVQ